MSTVQFCDRSPICPHSEMANTRDFLSRGQGSNPCADTRGRIEKVAKVYSNPINWVVYRLNIREW